MANDTHPLHGLTEDAFGHWLAGFVDGEGCFYVAKMPPHPPWPRRAYNAAMKISLREDDGPLLYAIQARTQIGRINHIVPRGQNPVVAWVIASKPDVAKLVALLDRYPLMSKKARDYEIWRRAVAAHAQKRPRGARNDEQDWSDMAALKDELHAIKRYEPVSKSGPR